MKLLQWEWIFPIVEQKIWIHLQDYDALQYSLHEKLVNFETYDLAIVIAGVPRHLRHTTYFGNHVLTSTNLDVVSTSVTPTYKWIMDYIPLPNILYSFAYLGPFYDSIRQAFNKKYRELLDETSKAF